jgi:hypothetical protein
MVCEGAETEPNYLEEIRQSKRIPSAHWTILPSELGTGPEKVVEYAERRAREDGTWDEIYCVFDRDDHAHYREAIDKARALDRRLRTKSPSASIRFMPIASVPCFELWFLLHFEPVTRELDRTEARRKLQRWITAYDKNLEDMFARTSDRLEQAFKNASDERRRAVDTGNDNPSTNVDILIKRLLAIAALASR